jgi:hypothetical protein
MWPVSISGGENLHWRGDGKEVFFLNGNALMRAEVTMSANRVTLGRTTAVRRAAVPQDGPVESV